MQRNIILLKGWPYVILYICCSELRVNILRMSRASRSSGSGGPGGPNEKEGPKVYRKYGENYMRTKNSENSRSALKYFEDFLASKSMPRFYELLPDELLDRGLYQEFANYLVEEAVEKTGDYLAESTAAAYMTGVVNLAKQITKRDIWTNVNNEGKWWYTQMRYEMKAQVYDRSANSGIALVKKAGGLDRVQMRSIIRYFLQKNTKEGKIEMYRVRYSHRIESNWFVTYWHIYPTLNIAGVSIALKLAMTYSAAGRGGEAMYCSYKKWQFNQDLRRLVDDWNDKKNLTSKPMTWGPDYEFLELDVFFLLACYFVTSGGGQHAFRGSNPVDRSAFVHPDFASFANPASAAQKLTEWLKVNIQIMLSVIFYMFMYLFCIYQGHS